MRICCCSHGENNAFEISVLKKVKRKLNSAGQFQITLGSKMECHKGVQSVLCAQL